jgi:hypothetical protein
MPAEIVNKEIRPRHRDIYVTLMDDYGTESHLTLSIAASSADRAAKVGALIEAMNEGQTQLETCAKEEGIDLTAHKTAGLAKKAAALLSASGQSPAKAAVK